jgi:asparagine synthetase B (glutamine-hydrolysing)
MRELSARMRSRGPDGSGYYGNERFGLAHERLAIMDPEVGGCTALLNPVASTLRFQAPAGLVIFFNTQKPSCWGRGEKSWFQSLLSPWVTSGRRYAEGGKQPIVYEEAKYSVCANGEIYNFRELQAKYGLTAAQTGSDSEVILQLYRHMGTDFVKVGLVTS